MHNFRYIGLLTAASIAFTPHVAHAGSLDGAKFEVLPTAGTQPAQPCPKSSYRTPDATTEGLPVLLGGLVSSFAGKAVDAFVGWLAARKERLNGTRSATYTGNFYEAGVPAARCITFTAGTFNDDGTVSPRNVYVEFVPVYYDLGAYTLKPVYLEYNRTVAAAKSKKKYLSLVITTKFNVPSTQSADGVVNSSELQDGSSFTFNFGQLSEGAILDFRSLEAVNAGLGQVAPQFPSDANPDFKRPLAYQMDGLWAETAEPSPLYTAAVGALEDNKEAIGKEIGIAIKEILGLNEPAAEGE